MISQGEWERYLKAWKQGEVIIKGFQDGVEAHRNITEYLISTIIDVKREADAQVRAENWHEIVSDFCALALKRVGRA